MSDESVPVALRNRPLVEAITSYVVKALDHLLKAPDPGFVALPTQRWVRTADDADTYRRVDEQKLFALGVRQNSAIFHALPEYLFATQMLAEDPEIGRQLGQLIGTSLGGRTISTEDFLDGLLLELVGNTGTLRFDAAEFERVYQRLEDSLYATTFAFEATAPLLGLREAPSPATLADGLTIDRMTEEDVTRLLDMNLLHSPMGSMGFAHAPRYVLRRRFELPKRVGNSQFSTPDVSSPPYPEELREVLDILRLLKPEAIASTGAVFRSLSPLFGWTISSPFAPIGQWWSSEYVLQEGDITKFVELHTALRSTGVTGRPFLDLAVRRIGYSRERHREEDRLIDLMIAAEALFLPTDDQEVGYKLALRAAYFGDDSDRFRRFDDMRKAYGERSKLVHGNGPRRRLTPAQLKEISDRVDGYLREALFRFLPMAQQQPKGDLVDWDEIVLGTPNSPSRSE